MKKEEFETLAEGIRNAKVNFDSLLHPGKKFPLKEFDVLFQAVMKYAKALGDKNWIHRDVAREISGFREYLQVESLKTPSEILVKADRMETILFSGYDPDFKGFEPPGL